MESGAIYILAMLGATAACILGVFYICAACLRDATSLHDVTVEARRMRIEFERRVSARNIGAHVEDFDDEEPFLVV